MAILLRDLYEDTRQQYMLHLICGETGLNNIMDWLYIAEDIGNIDFLKGGELIISTGMSMLRSEGWLKKFLLLLIEKKACGAILNMGKYIHASDITPEIKAICQANSFPLFSMPWDVHLSDISQNYCNRIFTDSQQLDAISAAFKNILQYPENLPETSEILEDFSYAPKDDYCISLLSWENQSPSADLCRNQLLHATNNCLLIRNISFIVFEYKKKLLFIWHNQTAEEISTYADLLLEKYASLSMVKNVRIGTGSSLSGLHNLKNGYKRAAAALEMGKSLNISNYNFAQMGIYRIFFSVSRKDILTDFCQQQLGTLMEYDALHKSNYLDTLEYYLTYNGHIAQIADAMICHRNTINYRVRKIRELMPVDFEDSDAKFQLQLAFCIRNYLKIFPSS